MSPEEIAKLISEDPDISESATTSGNLAPVAVPGLKKKRKTTKKRKTDISSKDENEDDVEKSKYKVNKITGQPEEGQILYSDVPSDQPQELTESVINKQLNLAASRLAKIIKSGELSASNQVLPKEWLEGEQLGYDIIKLMQTNLIKSDDSLRRIKHALTKLGRSGECRFIEDYKKWRNLSKSLRSFSDKAEIQWIIFPPPGWWGRKWDTRPAKKAYTEIFIGEVITRFLGLLWLHRDAHASRCNDLNCRKHQHLPFVIDLLCKGKISLIKVFDRFSEQRFNAIADFKKRGRTSKIKRLPEAEPEIKKLLNLYNGLIEEFGLKKVNASGLPPLAVGPKLREPGYAEKYIDLVKLYFGDEIVDRLLR